MKLLKGFAAVALILLGAATAFAQGTTATLAGTVTSEGSPLPGATITVTSPALQGQRMAVSGDAGGYTIPALPPGVYTVRIELAGMQPVVKKVTLSLAQTSRVDAELMVSAVAESITVTAAAPAVLETNQVATNVTAEVLDKLPVARTIAGAVSLAPGVSNGIAGFTISGAPSYDNMYLVNGTVVNENLRGQPDNLFIEDAIQETTVMTGGISAEYGRFTGGVISTLTRSGGNEFSGSIRDTLSNADWRAKTPWPTEADHIDKINQVFEETLGGFFWRDRIWFFAAGRQAKTDTQNFTTVTNLPYTFTRDEKRVEAKLTGQIGPNHNLVGNWFDISDKRINDIQFTVMDYGSLFNRELPNSLYGAQYNGVITPNLLLSANYANKTFAFVGSGSPFTDRINGTLMLDAPSGRRYWTSTFCGTCGDEERNNFSWTVKSDYFLSTRALGSHNFVAGVDRYSETRLVNNHQSGSDYRIYANTRIVGSTIYPVINQNSYVLWNPIFTMADGSHLRTNSVFVNDKWDLNSRFSFNIGVRYDKNDGEDDSGNVVSDDSAFSPRLGMQFDVAGDGRHRISANFARYVTKIAEGNVGGGGNAAGNPSSISWYYRGPDINAPSTPDNALLTTDKALAAFWAWFDSIGGTNNKEFLRTASISGLSTVFPEPIISPAVDEITLGYGMQIGRSAFARADWIMRDWKNFYATELLSNNPESLDQFGNKGDVAYIVNNDEGMERKYRGLLLQAQWQKSSNLSVGGSYTWSELRGNDTGEATATATSPNTPLGIYYPELLGYDQRLPIGYLPEDLRHRARIWASYTLGLGRAGALTVSGLQTYESGSPYSVAGSIDATCQTAGSAPCTARRPADFGYVGSQVGNSHTYFFSDRGELRTDELNRTDFTLRYDIPFRAVSFFAQANVTNVFDLDAVLTPDTTVYTRRTASNRGLQAFNPFNTTPVECPQGNTAAQCQALGAHFQKADTFGKAIGVSSYQQPRTYGVTAGIRF